ncbi:divalent-cation tolerance protein CutA [Thalassotalea sp. 1_MG-2023]|uniref:divalent-cation tolerance protein CutA n=1 Tax=Thalassotalea sp. 1_MG-2023 TaxID=3062680 RepID=UPI0026E44A2B|nr:divalent-cation tolerance protein CutA [Thalassotalea sp. 1_MG-2023]MDO6425791.1 divalent-cation tolerance protein CutA [Thalassotalea sp. 1_MG-2023]
MYQIVLCTCPSNEVANEIAESLVKQSIAACVNIISNVSSVYLWQGNIEKDVEVQLIIKSKAAIFKQLADTIIKLHPYDVPEIIALDINKGNQDYLTWLDESIHTHD